MTFRVEEEEEEEEAQEVIAEEPINPRIGAGANLHTMKSIGTGMPVRLQDPVQDLEGQMRRRLGMTIENTRRKLRIETLLDISLKIMRTGKELEALVQEEKDIVEEIEARIGKGVEAEETTMKAEEIMEETTVKAEEITAQIGKTEGIIVQDIDRVAADQGVEETTHQKRAEDTLAKIDEMVAKGPLVMEGP